MVYNFALPPLVLHAFYTGDVRRSLHMGRVPDPALRSPQPFSIFSIPMTGSVYWEPRIYSRRRISTRICRRAEDHGGIISYKTAEDGTNVPYELNMTWYSALNKKQDGDSLRIQIKRFIASRAIALVLQGVPGIYLHSLFGTHNDHAAVEANRENRVINRAIVDFRSLMRSMTHPKSKKYRINQSLGRMIQARTHHRAFHPNGPQKILSLSPKVFAVTRTSPEGDRFVVTLTNVTKSRCTVRVPIEEAGGSHGPWRDLLSDRVFHATPGVLSLTLQPYDVLWLVPPSDIADPIVSA